MLSYLQPFAAVFHPEHFLFCLPAMASSSSAEQLPTWEWVLIWDITNKAGMQEKVAGPRSWTISDHSLNKIAVIPIEAKAFVKRRLLLDRGPAWGHRHWIEPHCFFFV